MNIAFAEDPKTGTKILILSLDPPNIQQLLAGNPAEVKLEKVAPGALPFPLTVAISYTETPEAEARQLRETAQKVLDERTPRTKQQRPHRPRCNATIENIGVWDAETAPIALTFCAICGATLGTFPRKDLARYQIVRNFLAFMSIHVYIQPMAIVWDHEKAKSNQQKHRIRFAPAALVLSDPYAITSIDRDSDPSEERFAAIGADAEGRILVVIYTYRGEDIRLISARPATPRERQEYERQ